MNDQTSTLAPQLVSRRRKWPARFPVLLISAALAILPLQSSAQEIVVQLHVQPMPAPEPALKYQLLPRLDELNPGNAAQNYLKCFMEQYPFFFSKQARLDRDRYETMPLAELPLERVRSYGGGPLDRADWAARMDSLDWQNVASIESGSLGTPPSEVGAMQILAKALHVRFRGEVADRKFDRAVRTAKTMFAMARHLGEHPAEVANLVGLWAAHIALNAVEEMVQQPGCPNFYWALTDLPSPPVDVRRGVQTQQAMVAAELRLIRDDAPMTESELAALVGRLSGVIGFPREQSGQPPRSVRANLRGLADDLDTLRAARRRLAAAGSSEEKVGKCPPLQIILLDQKRWYEIERDERLMLLFVPVWQVECSARAGKPDDADRWPLADLLPNIAALRAERAELERQVALLRHVEALRLYAAAHDGKPAARAADIRVPLPLDPVTGKPFAYSVEETTAHIRGDSLAEKGASAIRRVHYSVTIHK